MKKILLLLTLVSTIHAHHCFEFVSNKVVDSLAPEFIQKLVDTFGLDNFFETGTYSAVTTLNAAPYFKKVVTVELHEKMFKEAQKTLARHKHATVYHGSSPEMIKAIASTLQGTTLFWLDAHYSGQNTAMTFDDENAPDAITPIRQELAAIKELSLQDCVILIDDIRGFGTEICGVEYLGCWAYPTVQSLRADLRAINPNFGFALLGDMLLAYDATKYNPAFSDTVIACTKTRLYDGYTLTDQELMTLENTIRLAPVHEKKYIKLLYDLMTGWQDAMFWHDMWYGLVALGDGNHAAAHRAFVKVTTRTQKFSKNRKLENKQIAYNHWRIDEYLQACKAK